MLSYQVRPRVFRLAPGKSLSFPADCVLRFHLQPPQPFGVESGGGRTCVRAVEGTAFFNANTGESTIDSKEPLSPLDVTIECLDYDIRLDGCLLTLSGTFASLGEVEQMVESVYFVLPTLLNVPFADPPYIERVDGVIASVDFRWELAQFGGKYRTTTQEHQEARFADSWDRMSVVAESGRRRLAAALHYFHVACRLDRCGQTAGEFVAESLLNLAKTLEVLFPPSGDGKTREAVRDGLRELGYSDARIERDFMPAMALRNEIDVGHVELGLFKPDDLTAIHAFVDRAEGAFREMLNTLLAQVESGDFVIAQHELGAPSPAALEVVARLKAAMEATPG